MSENLLFQIEGEAIVPSYESKVKRMRIMRNEIEHVNAMIKIKDSQIISMVVNNGSCKGKSRFSVYGNKENGGMKVYKISIEEMQEISKGKIPQMWIEKLKKVKMLEDKKMVETKKVEEVAVVEEVVNGGKVEMIENVKETVVINEVIETKGEVEMVEVKEVVGNNKVVEDTVETKVTEAVKEDISVDNRAGLKIDMKEINVSEEKTKQPKNKKSKNKGTTKLPVNADKYDKINNQLDEKYPINKNCKVAVLFVRDGYRCEMQLSVKAENKINGDVMIYLVNMKNGEIHLGNNGAMKIDKEKIMNADNYEVFNCLNKFDIAIKESDKSKAFERAQEFIEVSRSRVKEHNSMTVTEAYRSLTKLVITKAQIEENNSAIIMENRNYKYDAKAGIAQVRIGKLQETLDECNTSYKRREFCKMVKLMERSMGTKIILSNKSGGYGFNDSHNVTWFKFSTTYGKEVG